MRRTKIVATLGPASDSPAMLEKLIKAGVDVFRLNFSHGSHDEHRGRIKAIREAGKKVGRDVAILQDLCGPKIRTGIMKDGGIELVAGAATIITTEEIEGTSARFTSQYKELPHDVKPGKRILLDDGNLELEAVKIEGTEVHAKVIRGGTLKNKKGMNLPDVHVSTPSVTEKDLNDLTVGIAEGVDFVALSFIRTAEDMRPVREALKKGNCNARLIAKLEKPEAIENLDAIISAADGVMVARGDLGIEMPIQQVTLTQKKIIRRANELSRYVITATQMLETMTHSTMPTRAEVSDVTNAIFDGTDAIMLSGECAAGDYPVETVQMMSSIADNAENFLSHNRPHWDWVDHLSGEAPYHDAIGHAALQLVNALNLKAIVTYTVTGGTSLFLSKSRPFCPLLAVTPTAASARKMRMFWGVEPIHTDKITNRVELKKLAVEEVLARGIAKKGESILVVGGSDFKVLGAADTLWIVTV